MRIAITTDTYLPAVNGVVTSIESFRTELERQGHEVFILGPAYPKHTNDPPNVYRFASVRYPFALMREQRIIFPSVRFLRLLAKLKVDVVHSQVPAFTGAYTLLASRSYQIPHVHTFHTNFLEYMHYAPFPRSFSRWAIGWIARHYCGRCQRVISPSDGMRSILLDIGVDAPIRVLPTGLDLTAAQSKPSAEELCRRHPVLERPAMSHKRILCFAGRVGREKNLRFLTHVLAILTRRRNDVHFLLVGDGPDRADLDQEIARLHLSEHVTMTGYVDHSDVAGILTMSDLVVISSLTETQGLVVLESMAVGTPVVGIESTGISDSLGDNRGGLISPNDEEAFADRVELLLDDRERYERASREALEKVQRWSVPVLTRRLIELYRESIDDFARNGLPRYGRRGTSCIS